MFEYLKKKSENFKKRIDSHNQRAQIQALIETHSLTRYQLYEFDLRGFIILKNFSPQQAVDQANTVIDAKLKNEHWSKFQFFDAHPMFLDFLSDVRVLAICEQLIGHWFRLDGVWGIQEIPPFNNMAGSGIYNIHAGPRAEADSFHYRWYANRPHTTFLNFGHVLYPAEKGDGGLVFVPGSHKQNIHLDGGDFFDNVAKSDINSDLFVCPAVQPGDLIIFTEACMHGTKPWIPKDRGRRILYYKYSPGYAVWRKYNEMQPFRQLARNPIEKALLDEPYVGSHNDAERPVVTLHWRRRTLEYLFDKE